MNDPIDRPEPTDAAIDARLRAAGDRLRATAPDTARPSSSASRDPGRGRWVVGVAAAVVAAFVAGVGVFWAVGGRETVREAPGASEPAVTAPITRPEPDASAPVTTDGTTPDSTDDLVDLVDTDPAEIVEDLDLRDWDGAGGTCLTVTTGDGIGPAGTTMCLTGDQLASEFRAYLADGGQTWGYHHSAAAPATGWDGGSIFTPPDEEICGLPLPDEAGVRRWVVVSHCADGAALLTVLPTAPEVAPTFLVSTGYGMVVDAYLRQTLDHDTGVGIERLDLFEVPSALSGVQLRCLVIAPASTDRWFESCHVVDQPAWNSLFLHGGLPYALEATGEPRIVPLSIDASLATNGCTSGVVEVLAAIAEPQGMLGRAPSLMVSGIACPAATDPFTAPLADQSTSAMFSGVLLREGPMDGGLVVLARDQLGNWEITDTGTGIDPDPWPLAIPPTEWILALGDALPPIDVTETVAAEIPVASTKEALVDQIRSWIASRASFDEGPSPVVSAVPDLPLVIVKVIAADDSIEADTYAIWLLERDPFGDTTWAVQRAILVTSCLRGVTEVDGALLCV